MGVLGNGRTGTRRGSATGRGMPYPRRAVVRGGRVPKGGSPRATGHAGLASRAMSAAFAAILVAGMVPAALLATCGHAALASERAFPGVREYLAQNLDETDGGGARHAKRAVARAGTGAENARMARGRTGSSSGASVGTEKGDLRDTGQLLYVKYTLADRNSLAQGDTIDSIFSDADEAAQKIWAQYETLANVYDPGYGDCYVALLDSTAVTGEGKAVDYAFAKRDTSGSRVDEARVDLENGIAYLPKSLYRDEKGEETFRPLSAQLLVSYDFLGKRKSRVDVTLASHRLGVSCVARSQTVDCDGIDPELRIPVVAKRDAGKVSLSDLALYVGDSTRPLALEDGTNASYDATDGTLAVSLAGVTTTSLRVEVLPKGGVDALVDSITMPSTAQAANADRLGVWPYGKFTKLDLSKLKEGQAFTYESTIKYDYNANHFADLPWANKSFWATVKHVYTSFENSVGDNTVGSSNWVFSQIKKGTTWNKIKDHISETPVSASPDDINFMIALPGDRSVSTKIGGLNWSGLTSPIKGFKKDPKYDKYIDTVAFCSHITQPGNNLTIDEAYNNKRGKVTMRVLKIKAGGTKPYIIVGFCAPQVTTQSGISIIKFAVASKGDVSIKKTSTEPQMTDGCDAYSLEGATFGIYSDNACTKLVKQLKCDVAGKAVAKGLNAGTYYVREDSAPKGYLKSNEVKTVVVTGGKTSEVGFADKPCFSSGWNLLQKRDSSQGTTSQGSASLAGAEFLVKYYAGGFAQGEPTRRWVFSTDERGRIGYQNANLVEGTPYRDKSGAIVMPLGSYEIRETKPPKGYLPNNTTFRAEVRMGEGGVAEWHNLDGWNTKVDNDMGGRGVADDVIRGGVELMKVDSETGDGRVLGAATLEGATFDVIYRGKGEVDVGNKTFGQNDVVITIAATRDGDKVIARTGADTLPFGKYEIRESTSGEGYTNGGYRQTFDVSSLGIRRLEKKAANPIARGDLRFLKIDGATQRALAKVPFLVTAASDADGDGKHESHVLVSDENGIVTTRRRNRSNANDKALHVSGDGTMTIDEKILDPKAGVWFGGRTDRNSTAVDGRGALPYDSYEIQELRCKANVGRKLVSFSVTVRDDDVTIDRGTVIDAPGPVISTRLTGTNSSHVISANERHLIDTVSYEGLERGHGYTIEGTLMDASTGKALTDAHGKPLRATKPFTARLSSGSVDVRFAVDAGKLPSSGVVAFERLLDDRDVVASHESLSDPDQTIHVAKIATRATVNGSHVAPAANGTTITDVVSFEGLEPGTTYRVSGRLVDGATGKSLGEDAEKSVEFTPVASTGSISLEFKIDARALGGQKVVVFERLYQDEALLARHEDLKDQGQTVHFPTLKTRLATIQEEKILPKDGEVTLVDEVCVRGIERDSAYTLHAKLVDATTGEGILTADGTALTSELRFTAEKGSETKRVEFKNLSASDLPDNVVCVESLTDSSGREIAAHDSLHDEGQTVRRPAISTTLVTKGSGRHVVVSDKNIELVDTVSYQGLVPGLPYTLEGTLVDAETGRRIHVAGAESSRGFTPREPSGKTQVTFKIDARKLEGKALVAFETLKNESSVVVATHEDAQDKNQTVRVPTIKTTLTDTSRKSHEVVADGRIRLVDTIEFKALQPEATYRIIGTLMDAETGKQATEADGTPITAETEFTAEKCDGTCEVTFEFDGKSLTDHRVVAFERMELDGEVVARHEDVSDTDQSVTLRKPKTSGGKLPITGEMGIGAGAVATLAVTALAGRRIDMQAIRKRRGARR